MINYVVADVGSLPAGFYRVIGKIRQGDKVVGQNFWFQVTAEADALCTPTQ